MSLSRLFLLASLCLVALVTVAPAAATHHHPASSSSSLSSSSSSSVLMPIKETPTTTGQQQQDGTQVFFEAPAATKVTKPAKATKPTKTTKTTKATTKVTKATKTTKTTKTTKITKATKSKSTTKTPKSSGSPPSVASIAASLAADWKAAKTKYKLPTVARATSGNAATIAASLNKRHSSRTNKTPFSPRGPLSNLSPATFKSKIINLRGKKRPVRAVHRSYKDPRKKATTKTTASAQGKKATVTKQSVAQGEDEDVHTRSFLNVDVNVAAGTETEYAGGGVSSSGGGSTRSGTVSGNSGETSGRSGTVSGNGGGTSGRSGTVSGNGGGTSGRSGTVSGEGGKNSGRSGTVSGEGGANSGRSGTVSGGNGGPVSGGTGIELDANGFAKAASITAAQCYANLAKAGISADTMVAVKKSLQVGRSVMSCNGFQNPAPGNACGNCWAFTAAYAVSMMRPMDSVRNDVGLASWQMLTDCVKTKVTSGCSGGSPMDALDWMAKNPIAGISGYPMGASFLTGAPQACQAPTGPTGIMSYGWSMAVPACAKSADCWKSAANEVALLNLLNTNLFPMVIVYVDATNWAWYSNGIFPISACSDSLEAGNHVLLLCGYGVDPATQVPFWKLCNSWGTMDSVWGEKGGIRVPFGVNACGLANYAIRVNNNPNPIMPPYPRPADLGPN